jgi:hypothetical protein
MERVLDSHWLWAVIIDCNCNISASKPNLPIQNPLLLVTELRTRENKKLLKNQYKKFLSRSWGCGYRRGLHWKLELLTPLVTTSHYSTTVELHSLQFTTARVKPFPACCHMFAIQPVHWRAGWTYRKYPSYCCVRAFLEWLRDGRPSGVACTSVAGVYRAVAWQ